MGIRDKFQQKLLRLFKKSLTVVGARISERTLHHGQMVLNYMKLGRWMRQHDFRFARRVLHREEVWDAVVEQVRDRRVLYLEFGVCRGASMRYWSGQLKHAQSMLHGFDSFEGLPEDFDMEGPYQKGAFSTNGVIPVIDDPRVLFHKGWFDQVLPTFSVPEHEVLVVNLDADLYSSTIYVLRFLRPWIRPGTFLYFDDMSRPEHEPKAFAEFMNDSALKFRPISADQSLNTAFFECVP